MAEVIFVLGAGASVHAGAPVMSTFLDTARELLAADKVGDKRAEFEAAFSAISYLQRVHSKSKLDHNNIESVFSAVDLARTLGKLPGVPEEKIDSTLTALQWVIVRTLEESMHYPTSQGRVGGTHGYAELARLITTLRDLRPPLHTAVVSFNYDVAVDVSFAVNGLRYSYGLDDSINGVPLLKLHGSLNWGRAKDPAGGIIPYDIKQYVNDYQAQWFPGDQQPAIVLPISQHAMKELRKAKHAVYDQPVLVPPTWSKGEHHRGISKVWRHAAKQLEEARYIFVLGYSLPETDQFFRLLFGLGTEGRAILSRIAVLDPNPNPVSARFRDMLGPGALDRFSVFDLAFEAGLREIEGMLTGTRQSR